VVQDLIDLAQEHRLSMPRGDYRLQPEPTGGYMRYRMTLPVKGDAQAVQRFMLNALKAHRTLALEAVQFKREQVASPIVEAHVQWALLTRWPQGQAPLQPKP
jgi:hypothetical protein